MWKRNDESSSVKERTCGIFEYEILNERSETMPQRCSWWNVPFPIVCCFISRIILNTVSNSLLKLHFSFQMFAPTSWTQRKSPAVEDCYRGWWPNTSPNVRTADLPVACRFDLHAFPGRYFCLRVFYDVIRSTGILHLADLVMVSGMSFINCHVFDIRHQFSCNAVWYRTESHVMFHVEQRPWLLSSQLEQYIKPIN